MILICYEDPEDYTTSSSVLVTNLCINATQIPGVPLVPKCIHAECQQRSKAWKGNKTKGVRCTHKLTEFHFHAVNHDQYLVQFSIQFWLLFMKLTTLIKFKAVKLVISMVQSILLIRSKSSNAALNQHLTSTFMKVNSPSGRKNSMGCGILKSLECHVSRTWRLKMVS